MARPRKAGLDYFPHDIDATTDPKLESAILRYGAAAYAFYFVHLEYCYRSDDLSVDISATETGAEMREVIQRKLQISTEQYDAILNSFLRHGAFDEKTYRETGRLTSDGIKKRAGKVFEKREKDNERYDKIVSDGVSDAKTPVETPQRKEKKSKVNIESIKRFAPPSIDEVGAYCSERANGIDPQSFLDFYEARGWKLSSGISMRDWKAAIRTWERRERKPQERDRYIDVI